MFSAEIVDHGGRRGDAMRALAQWRHPVASTEALDVLHWVMHPALYRCIAMAIEIGNNFPSFFVADNSLSPTTIS